MLLSKADPANCVRAILNFVPRRWLWLIPNCTTVRFLRGTERTIIIACWTQPGPGHSVNTLSCNVGLFQPKTFQVPVTNLYIFIKIYSEIGPMMHVLCTGCSQSPSASPVLLGKWFCRAPERRWCSLGAGCATRSVSLLVGLRFALVLVSARMYRMFKTVCTFDMILHFQSHQSILWVLCVCGSVIIVDNLFLFCLQGNIPIFLSCYFFFLWRKIVTF